MKIGFNMLLWTTHLVEDQFDLLEKIKKVGYDGVGNSNFWRRRKS